MDSGTHLGDYAVTKPVVILFLPQIIRDIYLWSPPAISYYA